MFFGCLCVDRICVVEVLNSMLLLLCEMHDDALNYSVLLLCFHRGNRSTRLRLRFRSIRRVFRLGERCSR